MLRLASGDTKSLFKALESAINDLKSVKNSLQTMNQATVASTPQDHWTTYNDDRAAHPDWFENPSYEPSIYHYMPVSMRKMLSNPHRNIVDLGISTGEQHLPYAQPGKKIIGYDASGIATEKLQDRGMIARTTNLDSMDKSTGTLAYAPQLKQDLSAVSDIFMIKIAEYLEPQTLITLLHFLIDNALPGSCFYLSSYLVEKGNSTSVKFINSLPHKYLSSFFGPRIDMDIVVDKVTTHDGNKEKYGEYLMQQVIVRKRSV